MKLSKINQKWAVTAVLSCFLASPVFAQTSPPYQFRHYQPGLTAGTSTGTVPGGNTGGGTGTTPTPTPTPEPTAPVSTVLPDVATLVASSLNFQGIKVGDTSNYQVLTLHNSANQVLEFEISPTSERYGVNNDCKSVPAGGNCLIHVSFTPSVRGAVPAALGVTAIGYSGYLASSLWGQGLSAIGALTADGESSFGSVQTGSSAQRTFTFKNTGDYAALGTYARVDGTGLSVLSGNCGVDGAAVSVPANGSCSVVVKYQPTVAGNLVGGVQIVGDFEGSPASVELSGSAWTFSAAGVWSTTTASTDAPSTTLAYGTQATSSSTAHAFYLRNTGSAGALSAGFALAGDKAQFKILSVAAVDSANNEVACLNGSGTVAADGVSTTPCLTQDVALTQHSHIKVMVAYAPIAIGDHSATLTPTSDNSSVVAGLLTLTGKVASPVGDQLFGSAANNYAVNTAFVVPAGVTRIHVVAVGGGGAGGGGSGGGGGLAYSNDITVTPGETLNVVVGAGSAPIYTAPSKGGDSGVQRNGSWLVQAGGGTSGYGNGTSIPSVAGIGGTMLIGQGGGTGGAGDVTTVNTKLSGGGGAGGYAGNGGAGGSAVTLTIGQAGAGGGGAGGESANSVSASSGGGGGGGTGVYGSANTGTVQTTNFTARGGNGGSTSNGTGVVGYAGVSNVSSATRSRGGFPGGGGGAIPLTNIGAGGAGAVRIMWGEGRSFPYVAGN